MYRRHSGDTVDGVLAVDPVVLSYLLQATGPVRVPGGVHADQRPGGAHPAQRRLPAAGRQRAGRLLRGLRRRGVRRLPHEERQPSGAFVRFRPLYHRNAGYCSGVPDPRNSGRSATAGSPARSRNRRACRPSACSSTTAAARSSATTCGRRRPSPSATASRRRAPAAPAAVHPALLGPRRRGSPQSVLGLGMAGDPYTARTLVSVYSPAGGAVLERPARRGRPALGSGTERRRQVADGQRRGRPRRRPGPSTSTC